MNKIRGNNNFKDKMVNIIEYNIDFYKIKSLEVCTTSNIMHNIVDLKNILFFMIQRYISYIYNGFCIYDAFSEIGDR